MSQRGSRQRARSRSRRPVREALNLGEGDQVVFRVIEGERAILARTPDLLELAGSVPVPAGVRGLAMGRDPPARLGGPAARLSAFVDSNVLVRHLTGDPPDQARRATAFLRSGRDLVLVDLVVAEVVYVLESVYEVDRERVAELLPRDLGFPAVVVADEACCSCAPSRSTSSTGSTSPSPTWRPARSSPASGRSRRSIARSTASRPSNGSNRPGSRRLRPARRSAARPMLRGRDPAPTRPGAWGVRSRDERRARAFPGVGGSMAAHRKTHARPSRNLAVRGGWWLAALACWPIQYLVYVPVQCGSRLIGTSQMGVQRYGPPGRRRPARPRPALHADAAARLPPLVAGVAAVVHRSPAGRAGRLTRRRRSFAGP